MKLTAPSSGADHWTEFFATTMRVFFAAGAGALLGVALDRRIPPGIRETGGLPAMVVYGLIVLAFLFAGDTMFSKHSPLYVGRFWMFLLAWRKVHMKPSNLRFSNRALAKRSMKRGVNLGFVPAFVASLVSYLITVNPHVEDSAYLQFALQMVAIIMVSIAWAGMAMLIVAAGVFILHRLGGE